MQFIRSFTMLFSIGTLLFLGSCAEKTVIVVDETFNEEAVEVPDAIEQITITGSFRSVRGVMDELSCYTSNGGYVDASAGTIIAVSFNDNDVVSSCDKITVTGYMTSKKIESNGSCPEGNMGFLKVQSYIVGETDY